MNDDGGSTTEREHARGAGMRSRTGPRPTRLYNRLSDTIPLHEVERNPFLSRTVPVHVVPSIVASSSCAPKTFFAVSASGGLGFTLENPRCSAGGTSLCYAVHIDPVPKAPSATAAARYIPGSGRPRATSRAATGSVVIGTSPFRHQAFPSGGLSPPGAPISDARRSRVPDGWHDQGSRAPVHGQITMEPGSQLARSVSVHARCGRR